MMAWRLDSSSPVIPLPHFPTTDRWSLCGEATRTYSSDGSVKDDSRLPDQLIYKDYPGDEPIFLNDEVGSDNARRVRYNGNVMVAVRTQVQPSKNPNREAQLRLTRELQHPHVAKCRLHHAIKNVHYNLYYPAADMSLLQYLAVERRPSREWNWQITVLKAMGCLSHALAYLHEIEMTGINIEDILVANDQMCFANREYSSALIRSFQGGSNELTQAPSSIDDLPEVHIGGELHSKRSDIYTLGSIFTVMLNSIPKVREGGPAERCPRHFPTSSSSGANTTDPNRVLETPELLHLFSLMMEDDPELRPTASAVAEFLKAKSFGLGYTWLKDDALELTSPLCGDCCS